MKILLHITLSFTLIVLGNFGASAQDNSGLTFSNGLSFGYGGGLPIAALQENVFSTGIESVKFDHRPAYSHYLTFRLSRFIGSRLTVEAGVGVTEWANRTKTTRVLADRLIFESEGSTKLYVMEAPLSMRFNVINTSSGGNLGLFFGANLQRTLAVRTLSRSGEVDEAVSWDAPQSSRSKAGSLGMHGGIFYSRAIRENLNMVFDLSYSYRRESLRINYLRMKEPQMIKLGVALQWRQKNR